MDAIRGERISTLIPQIVRFVLQGGSKEQSVLPFLRHSRLAVAGSDLIRRVWMSVAQADFRRSTLEANLHLPSLILISFRFNISTSAPRTSALLTPRSTLLK
jgi:hypothetical protein